MKTAVKAALYALSLLGLLAAAIFGTFLGHAVVGGLSSQQIVRILGVIAMVQVFVIGWLVNIIIDCQSKARQQARLAEIDRAKDELRKQLARLAQVETGGVL